MSASRKKEGLCKSVQTDGNHCNEKKKKELPKAYKDQKYSLSDSLLTILDKSMDPFVSRANIVANATFLKNKKGLGSQTSFSQSTIGKSYGIPPSHKKFVDSSLAFMRTICKKDHHPDGFWDNVLEENCLFLNSNDVGYRKLLGRELKLGKMECPIEGKYFEFPFTNPNAKKSGCFNVEYYDEEPPDLDLDLYMKDCNCELLIFVYFIL